MSLFPDVIEFSALGFTSSLRHALEETSAAKSHLYNYDFKQDKPSKWSGRYDWLVTVSERESLGSKSTASGRLFRESWDEGMLCGQMVCTEDDLEEGEEAQVGALPIFAMQKKGWDEL